MSDNSKVLHLTNTCYACPSQWEGTSESGDDIYIRYRWGGFRIEVNGQVVHRQAIGDGLDGFISNEDLAKILKSLGYTIASMTEREL